MIFRGDKNALQNLVEELNERSDVELVYFETDTEHLYISHEKPYKGRDGDAEGTEGRD